MYLVANDPAGSAYQTFGGFTPLVAAKTGTAQVGENQVNNAIFICYAPYDDPQIAVAVVVEHGTSGASIASIARDFLDSYFAAKTLSTAVESELAMLP
jgi:penicillin-binding protein 2